MASSRTGAAENDLMRVEDLSKCFNEQLWQAL
jgi:hypothetical protein